MRQWSKNRLGKVFTVAMLCSSLVITMPTAKMSVGATGTDNMISMGTSDSYHLDPNGVLGKNSDVGIEVTKSITGEAGKKVTVAFKVKSNNENSIKLKSVYPIIDSDFPFETSGDAYKVALAGDEAKKQKIMSVSYAMTARNDLTTGYHSVKFITEYEKLDGEGAGTSFYVIKTINIYFKGSEPEEEPDDDNSGNTNDYNDDNGGDDDSDSGSSSGSNHYYDDYDDGYSYSGGGSQSDGEATAPKLLITGYDTNPKKIMAGEKFELTVHLQNTSKTTSVCNGKFLIGNEAGNFLPVSGSNAVFIDKIEPGQIGDLKIELKTSADLAQKNYSLIVKGDFDDGKGNTFSSNDGLSVPVYQEVKLAVTDVTMTPEELALDSEGGLMFTINNQGSAGVYNVTVAVEDDAVSSEGCYVGNIAGSSSAYANLTVMGLQDNTEKGTIKVVISYEDSEGTAGKLEQDIDCIVSETAEAEDFFDDMGDEFDEEEEGLPGWVKYLVIGLIVATVIAVVVVVIIVKKKKQAALLEEEFGEDDIEDENF